MSDEKARTLFEKQFPNGADSKISTNEFLEAARGVVHLIEKMGKGFAPVKYDMNGNIKKINDKYMNNVEKYTFMEDMLLDEKEEGLTNKTIDAVQWLRRGLHFIQRYFEYVIEDDDRSEIQALFLKQAYEETLQPYHGWMGSQLFGIISKFAPNRKNLFYILARENGDMEEIVEQEMDMFVCNLASCIRSLVDFYSEYDLETFYRV